VIIGALDYAAAGSNTATESTTSQLLFLVAGAAIGPIVSLFLQAVVVPWVDARKRRR
jgi:hypothetical protein